MNIQLEFKFMDDLLTPMEKIMKLICEESFKEDDEIFIKMIMKLTL